MTMSKTLDAEVDAALSSQVQSIEEAWRQRQPFLAFKGYMLRPRYHKDWEPSWKGTNKDPSSCEDAIELQVVRYYLIYVHFVLTLGCSVSRECDRRDSDL